MLKKIILTFAFSMASYPLLVAKELPENVFIEVTFAGLQEDIKKRALRSEQFLSAPEAKANCQKMIAEAKQEGAQAAECYTHFGNIKLAAQAFDEAKPLLETALNMGNLSAFAYEALGDTYFLMKNYTQALTTYAKAQEALGQAQKMGDMQLLSVKSSSLYYFMGQKQVSQTMLSLVLKLDDSFNKIYPNDPALAQAKMLATNRLQLLAGAKEITPFQPKAVAETQISEKDKQELRNQRQAMKNNPREEAINYRQAGAKLRDGKDYTLALFNYFQGMMIFKTLAGKAPENAVAQFDYALALQEVAEMQVKLKKQRLAVNNFTYSMEVLEKLLQKTPHNLQYSAAITPVFLHLITLMQTTGEPRVKEFSNNALIVIGRYHKAQPEAVIYKITLALIHVEMAKTEKEKKTSHIQAALRFLKELKAKNQLDPEDEKLMQSLEESLGTKA